MLVLGTKACKESRAFTNTMLHVKNPEKFVDFRKLCVKSYLRNTNNFPSLFKLFPFITFSIPFSLRSSENNFRK